MEAGDNPGYEADEADARGDNLSGEYDNQFAIPAGGYDSGPESHDIIAMSPTDLRNNITRTRSVPASRARRPQRQISSKRYLKRGDSQEPLDPDDVRRGSGSLTGRRGLGGTAASGEDIELQDLEIGLGCRRSGLRRRRSIGDLGRQSTKKMNGYEYYQWLKRVKGDMARNVLARSMSDSSGDSAMAITPSSDGAAPGPAAGTSQPDEEIASDAINGGFSAGSFKGIDYRRTRKFLATVRVRRKSQKRRSSRNGLAAAGARGESESGGEDLDSEDYVVRLRGAGGDAVVVTVGREESGEEEEYEEDVGLPSTHATIKALTQRKAELHQARASGHVRELEGEVVYSEGLSKKIKDFMTYSSEAWERLNFWSQQFKEIEGRFGIATSTYFRFTRWLMKINLLVFVLFLGFLYIPQLSYDSIFEESFSPLPNQTGSYEDLMFRCSNSYDQHMENITDSSNSMDVFLDLAQGTGYLENTMLFYGYYSNLSFWMDGKEGRDFEVKYNMGLGYLLTVGISFIAVFIMIVKNSSSTIKEAVTDFDNKAFPLYTNAVFSGWDYCIKSEKMAFFKQKIIFNEFKSTLEEMRWKQRRANRTAQERFHLYLKRAAVNFGVVALLGGSFTAIALATNFMLEKQKEVLSGFEGLVINYLPSIVIAVLNLIVPEIFMILCDFEEYSHNWTTRMTIVRAVVLRLASVWVLVVALYNKLQTEQEPYACPEEYIYNATVTKCCGNTLWQTDVSIGGDSSGRGTVKCWETYVGQQFYKLCLVDFISISSVVLLVGLPRRFLYGALKEKYAIVQKIGRSKFDLPVQVLDIVYSQTLCWIGMFFTPLLPAITFIKVFIFFFLKKFELLYVAQAPDSAYGASRSYSFFQSVLLISFIVIASLLGYMIGNYNPSMSCGPFRHYSKPDHVMFSVVTNEVNSWDPVPRSIAKYFGTVAFVLPAFLLLCLAIYYYSAMSSGYRRMEKLLKQELKSEAHDKQFLLARVDDIIKEGQLK